ncbi:MAG: SMC family ATPase, partial [Anaerolineae bacterium]|nr:SMC family ATPase [Anaerolineae bacterium]
EAELASYERAIATNEPRAAKMEALQIAAQEAQAKLHQVELDMRHQSQRLADAREAMQQAQAAREVLRQSKAGHHAYMAAETRLTELDQQRAAREKLRQERTRYRTEVARLQERAAAATEAFKRGQAAQARVEELQPLVEEQQRLEEQLRLAEDRARDASRLDSQLSEMEQQIARELAMLQALRDQTKRATKLAAERTRIEEEITSLGERRSALTDEISHSRARLEQITSQTAALQQATAVCPTCEQALPEGRRQKLLARNDSDKDRLRNELTRDTKRISELAQQERSLKERLKRLQKDLRKAPSTGELARAEERYAKSVAALERIRRDRERLSDAAASVGALRAAIEELGDPRSEQRAARQIAEGTIAAMQTLATMRSELAVVQEQVQAIETSLAAYDGLDEAIAQARAERERHKPGHEAYLGARQAAQALPQTQHRLAEMEDALQTLSAKRAAAVQNAAQAAAAYDADAYQRVNRELSRAREQAAAARAQHQSLEEQRSQLQEEIDTLARLRAELLAQQEALAQSRATSELLSYLRALLRDAGPLITQRLVRRISHQAAVIYGELMGQADGRLVWEEDYGLSLDLGREQRSYEQLSGGERMAAALAVRMALLRETSAVDIAFFDEPTAHLDSQRRERLAERIMGVRGFSQLFVISHDDTFERAAQSYVRVWRDADGSHAQT